MLSRIRAVMTIQAGLSIALILMLWESDIDSDVGIVGTCFILACVIYSLAAFYYPVYRMSGEIRELLMRECDESRLNQSAAGIPGMEPIVRLVNRYSSFRSKKNVMLVFNKQTELTALQSQINPHFLYNTLESIRGQALLDDNHEIAEMVEALSAFFRYSISGKDSFVTLRDELNNIKNYILIQRYRFNNRFSLEVIIDEDDEGAYEYLIPRLIIQPIVENAIFHGLEEKSEDGKVTIEIIVTEQNLIITVSDNGKGMEADKLEELNRRIHAKDTELVDENHNKVAGPAKKNTGIALPNIHRRISLLFGAEYGVNVYSTLGQGTDVEITVPANYKRESGIENEEGIASHQ